MLDITTSSHSKPSTPSGSSNHGGGKRIPASLMKMRRESLGVNGKYKLPIIDASKLPDNSLVSMAVLKTTTTTTTTTTRSGLTTRDASLPAFCTPKRHTRQSLRATLDLATSQITTSDLTEESTTTENNKPRRLSGEISVGSGGGSSSNSSGSNHSRGSSNNHRSRVRRSLSSDDGIVGSAAAATTEALDALVKSGLATPRRPRRSIRLPATSSGGGAAAIVASELQSNRRLSKFKNHNSKTTRTGSSSCNDSLGGSSHSGSTGSNGSTSSSSCQQKLRRNRTVDDSTSTTAGRTSVDILCTPRRSSRNKASLRGGVRRSNTMPKLTSKEEHVDGDGMSGSCSTNTITTSCTTTREDDDDCSSSNEMMTPVPSVPSLDWKCTCGEENHGNQPFCGMCGTPQRWECADCSYANKCKFRFCGMCGIPKKVKGSTT